MSGPLQIRDTFVALDDTDGARPLPVDAGFRDALRAGTLGPMSRLISFGAFEADRTTWEKHPAGEELVMLLDGEVELWLERGGGAVSRVRLTTWGQYVLVPRDTWHTAKVNGERLCFSQTDPVS